MANQILAFGIWIIKCRENQLVIGVEGKKTHPERPCSRVWMGPCVLKRHGRLWGAKVEELGVKRSWKFRRHTDGMWKRRSGHTGHGSVGLVTGHNSEQCEELPLRSSSGQGSGTSFQYRLLTPRTITFLSLCCRKTRIPCFFASLTWGSLYTTSSLHTKTKESLQIQSQAIPFTDHLLTFFSTVWAEEPAWGSGGETRASCLLLRTPFLRAL